LSSERQLLLEKQKTIESFPLPCEPFKDFPVAGKFSRAVDKWYHITNNEWILEVVRKGFKIDFLSLPIQKKAPNEFVMTEEQELVLDTEVQELIKKGAIRVWSGKMEELFLANLFTVPKKGGTWRPVLNLTNLNEFVRKESFKMEGLKDVRNILKKGDWMVKLDFKDAYFHIPMAEEHRRFIAFKWKGVPYVFNCLVFGLTSSPRIFSKVMKAVVAYLRAQGIRMIFYLDDWLILAETKEKLMQQLQMVIKILHELGFTINWVKSKIEPSTKMEFLGTEIDSQVMLFKIPKEKIVKTKKLIKDMIQLEECFKEKWQS